MTGVAEALAVQALAEEMGWKMSVCVHTDSSAAKAVASRRGLGKLRHIELKYLWVPELVQEQRIAIKKINGLDNPADCLTKPKDFKCFEPKNGQKIQIFQKMVKKFKIFKKWSKNQKFKNSKIQKIKKFFAGKTLMVFALCISFFLFFQFFLFVLIFIFPLFFYRFFFPFFFKHFFDFFFIFFFFFMVSSLLDLKVDSLPPLLCVLLGDVK